MIHSTTARRGATMVTVVILLPVLFALAAAAVNLAYIQVVNAKLQVVTDAAARAASIEYVDTGDEALALAAAQQIANLNPVESTVMAIESTDLEFGLSQRNAGGQAYTFTTSTNGNSVRLTTNSFAAGAGDAVEPFFPIFGPDFQIRPVFTATNAQTTLDVVIIVDRSGSMAFAADEPTGGTPAAAPPGWGYGQPVPPNSRWLDLVDGVNVFCDQLENTAKVEKVGLCSYSGTAAKNENLTEDYLKIMEELNKISDAFPGGSTNIGSGILEGINAVTDPKHCRPWANNALVLMSDGINTAGTDPLTAAANAAANEIPIYTISFSVEADQGLMQQIADMTGGTHYHAVDATQLQEAFRTIAKRLPSLLTE